MLTLHLNQKKGAVVILREVCAVSVVKHLPHCNALSVATKYSAVRVTQRYIRERRNQSMSGRPFQRRRIPPSNCVVSAKRWSVRWSARSVKGWYIARHVMQQCIRERRRNMSANLWGLSRVQAHNEKKDYKWL
eukprot:PhF_6_TR29415/c0_g1_i1/m.43472